MKDGNFDFFVMTLQTSCGTFRQRERVTLQTSCGAERVKCIKCNSILLKIDFCITGRKCET